MVVYTRDEIINGDEMRYKKSSGNPAVIFIR